MPERKRLAPEAIAEVVAPVPERKKLAPTVKGAITRPDPEMIRDISERVYRERLGERDAASMVEKDGDGGVKLRNRSMIYDSLTRVYLKVIHTYDLEKGYR